MENMDSPTASCPCKLYSDDNLICKALESSEKTTKLIKWITGNYSTTQTIVCEKSSSTTCMNRINTSLLILNSIRHSCREHLEHSSQLYKQKEDKTVTQTVISYESSFPSLNAGSVSSTEQTNAPNRPVARKKLSKGKKKVATTKLSSDVQQASKQKRRIRPAKTISSSDGNIANLPSETPFQSTDITVDQDFSSINDFTSNNSRNGMLVDAHKLKSKSTAWPSDRSILATSATSSGGIITNIPSDTTIQQNINGSFKFEQPSEKKISLISSRNSKSVIDQEPPSKGSLSKDHPSCSTEPAQKIEFQNPGMIAPQQEMRTSSQRGAWKEQAIYPDLQKPMLEENCISQDPVQSTTYIKNLSSVYVSLIKNSMVPSTPLELTLLVELLTINDNRTMQDNLNKNHLLLTSAASCRYFSLESLPQLKNMIAVLPLKLLAAFVACPPILENLSDLTEELALILKERQDALTEIERGFSGSTQPILVLPFDQMRDSRHNYKSREEQALYQNREESRDAFLYQLRHFQNIRGKVLDLAQLESSLINIRRSAKNVIQGVQMANMYWFVEIFFDLLLQIGLVPMEETDKELLKITNKEKLQKLHKRFSSKVVSSKGNSTKLLSESDSWQSPEKEVFRYFPGHQEFFLLFIQATDSYSFSVHLKSRLLSEITELATNNNVKGISERLPKLEMLAKFLGVVVFSPNWHSSGIADILHNISERDLDMRTASAELNFPMQDELTKIKDEVGLLNTVPWILSFLRMAKWDSFSMRSSLIQETITRLLSIYETIRKQPSPNVHIVSLWLEAFFHQVVGLRRVQSLIGAASGKRHENCLPLLHSTELQFSDGFLFSSIPHLDEFSALLVSATKIKQSGAVRKMRPSVVSEPANNSFSTTSLSSGGISEAQVHGIAQKSFEGEGNGKERITERLVEMFFHQHRDLKEICEFVVEHAVQNVASDLEQKLKSQEVTTGALSSEKTNEASMLLIVESDMRTKFVKEAENSVVLTVQQALIILFPATKSRQVKDIATAIALKHAQKIASSRVALLIKASARKYCDKILLKIKKMEQENQRGSS